jgi:hypothetical protein
LYEKYCFFKKKRIGINVHDQNGTLLEDLFVSVTVVIANVAMAAFGNNWQ